MQKVKFIFLSRVLFTLMIASHSYGNEEAREEKRSAFKLIDFSRSARACVLDASEGKKEF